MPTRRDVILGLGAGLAVGGQFGEVGIASAEEHLSFTSFDIHCTKEYGFNTLRGGGTQFRHYNIETHRYEPDYVNPSFVLQLSAWRGLIAKQPRAASTDSGTTIARRNTWRNGSAANGRLDDLLVDPAHPGNPLPPPRDWEFPDDFVRYEWTVAKLSGSDLGAFTRIVERDPIDHTRPPYEIHVPARGTGSYRITCRAVFDDRSEETTLVFVLHDHLIVSIGDSFASGQGNPDAQGLFHQAVPSVNAPAVPHCGGLIQDYHVQGPMWLEPAAARSQQSFHAMAADTLQRTDRFDGAVVQHLVTFLSFARTGAEIYDGLLGPQQGTNDFIGYGGQLDEILATVRERAVDALLVSIGGNDAGFAGVLEDLVEKDFSIWRSAKYGLAALAGRTSGLNSDDERAREEIEAQAKEALGVGLPVGQEGKIANAYEDLFRRVEAIRSEIRIKEIYISTYPNQMFETYDESGNIVNRACGIFSHPDADMTPADMRLVGEIGDLLNDLIRRKAAKFEWKLVDIDGSGDFAGRGYCAPEGTRLWRQSPESCAMQGNYEGTAHPNGRGQEVSARILATALQTQSEFR